ncbi:ABC transporter permease [Gillisia limnaea]|uniref:Transport permease protein n=1 Tax=Gillisia limnaea (strain DSM 15749 / LMG 21470 / R-8282) TaxID=865937 RepID=H2BT40_GILLR|nr:ABC transporter permease [Gillisia limnaea]EHQ02598.1 ABC-2 type transporter [Gillisia limnaea DSM 15749]
MSEKPNKLGSVNWEWEIKPETSWWNISLIELYSYTDLLQQLVRKDFLGLYQQTLLGPFWALLQPLLTVLIYVVVFNNIIGISTGSVPPFLFNLIGITLWNLFSEIFLQTSKTFSQNADLFSKVYFPRIIVALSTLWLQLLLFGIQLLLLIVAYIFFLIKGEVDFNLGRLLLIFPVIAITTGIGFGGGLIFSVLTAKYRDLLSLIQLIIRLLMFVCPVFYTLSMVPEKMQWLVNINPLSSLFEYFRFAFLGMGSIDILHLSYSTVFMLAMVCFGVMFFNKMSDKLIDVL